MRIAALTALTAGFGLALVPLALAEPWQVQEIGGANRAVVVNDTGSLNISIFCGGDGAMISIVHDVAVPWVPNQPADLVIDGEIFSLTLFRENGNASIFNLKPQTLKPAMVGALRSGDQLVLGGSALTDVDEAERVFTLDGSSRALNEVPGGCT
jgi:hypothetical protein